MNVVPDVVHLRVNYAWSFHFRNRLAQLLPSVAISTSYFHLLLHRILHLDIAVVAGVIVHIQSI